MIHDLRLALRALRRSPGFTAVAVATLALGIGANTVIFSGVHWVLFRDLPYPEADRLVVVYQVDAHGNEMGVSYPDFADWRAQATVFAEMAAARTTWLTMAGREEAERVTGAFVSPQLLPMLAARVGVGRTFTDEDFRPESERVVILGDTFWKTRMGAEANIIGQRLTLDAREHTVIGVMPPAFAFPFRAELWLPLGPTETAGTPGGTAATPYEILARLRPRVTLEQATSETAILARRSSERRVVGQQVSTVRVQPLRETFPSIAKHRRAALVLQVAVALVLLIACANLASLLLARNTERRQDLALRLALGAGAARLIRLVLAEALLVGVVGALVGLALAGWGLRALQAGISWRPVGMTSVELDAPVLLVTLCVALITVLGFGLVPAVLATRMRLECGVRSTSGPTARDAGTWGRKALVVCEIALAVMLLAGSAAMVRTLLDLTVHSPGFEPERALTLSLTAPPTRDTTQRGLAIYFGEALRRVQAVPGVLAVGGISYLPLTGYNPGTDFTIERRAAGGAERADIQRITPRYFDAMGIPLLRGRSFVDADMRAGPEVVLVNQAFAGRFWPDRDPVGEQIRLLTPRDVPGTLTVVGVVGDLRPFGADSSSRPELYLPLYHHAMTLIIRTPSEPAGLVPAIRDAARELTRKEAPFRLRTMPQVMTDWMASRRIIASLLGGMAGVALLLTALGVYGVVSHQTLQRTPEIGVHMALGAETRDVYRLVMREGLALATAGVVTGLAGAYGMLAVLRILPFRLSPLDPLTLAGVAIIAATVALLASFLPARRAARVDPMVAMRCE